MCQNLELHGSVEIVKERKVYVLFFGFIQSLKTQVNVVEAVRLCLRHVRVASGFFFNEYPTYLYSLNS